MICVSTTSLRSPNGDAIAEPHGALIGGMCQAEEQSYQSAAQPALQNEELSENARWSSRSGKPRFDAKSPAPLEAIHRRRATVRQVSGMWDRG